jgi:uncharacterized protein DUF3179
MKKWILLTVISVSAFATVFIPAWLIQPFKAQTSQTVHYAYMFRRVSPWLTLLFLAVLIFILILNYKNLGRWWQKATAFLLLIVCLFSAWFARQNHFEWMFNPLKNPAFVAASKADFVNPSDMVLGVKINGDDAAYPVRLLAYHHLVQDTVGGKPIVATY